MSGHFSKAYSLRKIPGLILWAISAASMRRVPEPHIGSMKSVSPFHPVISIIPAARTSLRGASTDSCLYPRRCRLSPLESRLNVQLSSAIWILSRISGFEILILGLLPVFSRNWSTIASLTLCATTLECLNSSEKTTESTENVLLRSRYSFQSIFFISLYTSSASLALKCFIGLRSEEHTSELQSPD